MRVFKGLVCSVIIHGLILLAGMGIVAHARKGFDSIMEIDLGRSSLILRPAKAGGRPAARAASEPWVFSAGQPKKTRPKALPTPAAAPLKEIREEITTEGEAEGGAAAGGESWVPVSSAAYPPQWREGMITQDDYPRAARRQGKEGRVVVSLVVDEEGKAQNVQIVEGAEPFSRLVLEKLKSARFSPARGPDNRPMAVKIVVPIEFKLQ